MTFELAFDAIGTKWQIIAQTSQSTKAQSIMAHSIKDRIEAFDRNYSRFRSDSLVTRMSQQPGTYDLPADGYTMLRFYEQLYQATEGKVTPLIGQVMSDAGYDANYSLQPVKLTQPPAWEEVLSYTSESITAKTPAILDFGAAGKGYLIDIVGALMEDNGFDEFVINAGGDILQSTLQTQPLQVGLENPFNTQEIIGIAAINNQSICASAGSRRKWAQYTHILDPKSLESPQVIQATWVIAQSAMVADGLATALFFVPAAKLQPQFSFDYAILHQDMGLHSSHTFPFVTLNQA